MSTVEDKKNIKRIRLLDAAYELFIKKSVNSTAIDDVVKAAGVAKGTFYLYFRDKYDLLDQIVAKKSADVICDAYDELCEKNDIHNMSLLDIMAELVALLISKMEEKKEVLTLIDKNLSTSLRAFATLHDQRFNEVKLKLLNEFTSNGFTTEQANMTIYLIVDLVGSVCLDALIYTRPYDIEKVKPALLCATRSIIVGVQKTEVK